MYTVYINTNLSSIATLHFHWLVFHLLTFVSDTNVKANLTNEAEKKWPIKWFSCFSSSVRFNLVLISTYFCGRKFTIFTWDLAYNLRDSHEQEADSLFSGLSLIKWRYPYSKPADSATLMNLYTSTQQWRILCLGTAGVFTSEWGNKSC